MKTYQVLRTATKYKVIPTPETELGPYTSFVVESTKARADNIATVLNAVVKVLKVKYCDGELDLIAQELIDIADAA